MIRNPSLLVLTLLAARAAGQSLAAVSVDGLGVARGGAYPVLSATGRFVVFASGATDLVLGDTNGRWDLFLRDLELGVTTRVNVDSAGGQEAGPVGESNPVAVAVTPDGRYVLFDSEGANLVANDTNGLPDAFLRDTWLGTTELVAVNSQGHQTIPISSVIRIGNRAAAMSSDARFVLFTSDGIDLVPGWGAHPWTVYVRDRLTGTNEIASLGMGGAAANQHSIASGLTADGRHALFVSLASNLVPGDTNGYPILDVFVRDLDLGTTARVNVGAAGQQADDTTSSVAWSADGRWIAFASMATTLVPGDTNATEDVFVKDVLTGGVERVSMRPDGSQVGAYPTFWGASVAISSDGRFVGFASESSELVADDTNGKLDVFLHDRANHATERVSLGADMTQLAADCYSSTLSADGRRIAFDTPGRLASGDTNDLHDVYVRDRGAIGPYATYCHGSVALCPCGNGSGTYAGCANTFGPGGLLTASGGASVSADSLVLAASGLPPTAACLYYQGTAPVNGGVGSVFGDGLRCVGGSILRLGTRAQTNGASALGGGGAEPSVSIVGNIPAAGGTRAYQVWYRNAADFCTTSTFNLTNGIRIGWTP